MDVFDVAEKYAQLLERQKQTLQKSKKRQGERPRDREPRDQACLKFLMTRMTIRNRPKERHFLNSSFLPPPYLPCTAPLAELKPTAIRDLQLETHHRGTYLLLRAITPPNRITAVMIMAEDERDDVISLQLYQQEEEETREASDIVDVGTIVLVKEPYFKVMASGDYGLRVDHLSDIVRLNDDDPMVPQAWRPRVLDVDRSAESIKLEGNDAMGGKKYWQAIRKYSEALSQPATVNEVEIIKRNRAPAFLKTKQFDAALLDTGFPDFGPYPNEKALFRAAEALYSLGRFTESCEVLELLCSNFSDNERALEVLDRAQRRVSEQKTGNYDFKLLQAEARKFKPPELDHATYIGPVEVRKTESKGRGLFVTKAVKAGDLLLCEKAFAHAYVAGSDEGKAKITLLMNPKTNQAFMGGQADLIRMIAQKLHRNPSVAPAFTGLYRGTYEAVSTPAVDGKPIVDTFLVERIMSLNVFGCPLSSLNTHRNTRENKSKDLTAYHSCGIWTQASYINHSCTSNAHRSFIGDMMIVRATQDLEPDTELTFWYQSPGEILEDSKKMLKHWNFVCDCAICRDTKETKPAVIAERKKLLERIKQLFVSRHGVDTSGVERLLKALGNTYTRPAIEVPRLLLWETPLLLTQVYLGKSNMTKVLESVGKVLVALGFDVVGMDSSSVGFRVVKWGLVLDHVVEVFVHARTAFRSLKALEDSKRAEEYAKVAYRIVVGEDTSFESTYSGH